MTVLSTYVKAPFDGTKTTLFNWIDDFLLTLRRNNINGSILRKDEMTQRLMKAFRLSKAKPDATTLVEKEFNLHLIAYEVAVKEYKDFRKKLEEDADHVMTLLQQSVTTAVFMNIQQASTELVDAIETAFRKFPLYNYPQMLAQWAALQLHYQPDLSESLAAARQLLESHPPNTTYRSILDATNTYICTVGRHPVQDENGNQVTDPTTGKPKFEQVDPHMMKNILIRLIGQSNNPGRHSLIQQWNMDPTYKFDKMYSQLRTIVLAQNEPVGPYPSMPSVVGSTSAAAVLPTTQQTTLVANAALTNPHDVAPRKRTPNAYCKNCKRKGHYTSDCNSCRCETCKVTFPTLDDRLNHARDAHPPRTKRYDHNDNGYDRYPRDSRHGSSHGHSNRERSQGRGRSQSRGRSQDRYQGRDRSQGRERSRDRYQGRRDRSRSRDPRDNGQYTSRAQSPHPRVNEQGNSSAPFFANSVVFDSPNDPYRR